MKLTDTKCKNTKPNDKTQKIADGDGLYLMVYPHGSKIWQFRYSYLGRRKTISFGKYPAISLFEARRLRMEAREQLAKGLNPSAVRKFAKQAQAQQLENSFEQVALRWKSVKSTKIKGRTLKTLWLRLEKHILPELRNAPIKEIKRVDLVGIFGKIEKKGRYETAKKLAQICAQIFEHALNEGLIENNPATGISGIVKSPKMTHRACISPEELPELLQKINQSASSQYFQTYSAIKLLMHTFVRTNELIEARWDEFNLEEKIWIIPSERMKMQNEHKVPLSNQVVETLKALKERFPKSEWILPSPNGYIKHVSNNIVLHYLKRLGYKGRMTGHGFRSLAASISTEKLKLHPVAVDKQLAHQGNDRTRSAYFRAEFMEERIELMQTWSDYIEKVTPKA